MDTLQSWFKPEVIWFLLGLILILLEFQIPGVITVFFGIGAWVTAFICLFLPIGPAFQLFIFLVVSILSLVLLRKWLKGYFDNKSSDTGTLLNEFIGERAVVTEMITPTKRGKVEFHGSNWEAEAYEEIQLGTVVEIIDKKNITLIVRPL
jgi:membrane protein implicated in regulation of membrane protease activity